MTNFTYQYDDEKSKLFWQVEALKGQVRELERERNQTANILLASRQALIHALKLLDMQSQFTHSTDAEIIALFEHTIRNDYRFSLCPNADQFHCRPVAMRITRDGDLVQCDDCGWNVIDHPPPVAHNSR